jgi:endonuclease/exonuclease/phosphatase (EEP) superfamily protein YafD
MFSTAYLPSKNIRWLCKGAVHEVALAKAFMRFVKFKFTTAELYDLPELMPAGRIDHVLYRGQGLVPVAWARLISPDSDRRLSDHDPVHVQFNGG